MSAEFLFPVYEFRPLPNALIGYGELLRLTENGLIPDDGEYGLAFARGSTVLYVDMPYQRNLLWKWYSNHWSSFEREHPRGNAWHYMLREGESEWGGSWKERDKHPNEVASRKAMNLTAANHRCANGRSIGFDFRDEHINAGLLRERDSKTVVVFPQEPSCMYCGDGAASLIGLKAG